LGTVIRSPSSPVSTVWARLMSSTTPNVPWTSMVLPTVNGRSRMIDSPAP
jgi:hypothetical protein